MGDLDQSFDQGMEGAGHEPSGQVPKKPPCKAGAVVALFGQLTEVADFHSDLNPLVWAGQH